MTDINSTQNERVKYVVRLRDHKRQREDDGAMLVEGRYELELALESGLCPLEIFFCAELAGEQAEVLKGMERRVTTVSRIVFEKMSQREGPDGWLAIFPLRRMTLEMLPQAEKPLLLLAEAVEKPGNLGAMLRSADAAGVDGLILCDPRADTGNPNVVRASRGTVFTVPAAVAEPADALAWLRGRGIRIMAATPQGDRLYTDVDLRQGVCIAMGTEDKGLSAFWMENADLKVRIPMAGKVNSLNVSTSTAIILYEAVRQRGVIR